VTGPGRFGNCHFMDAFAVNAAVDLMKDLIDGCTRLSGRGLLGKPKPSTLGGLSNARLDE
jgi:hypothetical protein